MIIYRHQWIWKIDRLVLWNRISGRIYWTNCNHFISWHTVAMRCPDILMHVWLLSENLLTKCRVCRYFATLNVIELIGSLEFKLGQKQNSIRFQSLAHKPYLKWVQGRLSDNSRLAGCLQTAVWTGGVHHHFYMIHCGLVGNILS